MGRQFYMKQNFTFLFLFLLTTVFGQKTVNDSIEKISHDKYESLILKKTQLPDLLKTKEEFYFRLSYHGTKIDIWKDSTNNIHGLLTKFTFKTDDNINNRDTIFEKYPIHKSKEVYDLINESNVLKIPSEKEIKNWGMGVDGTTYTFEFSNQKNYQIKSYWTPSSQDSTIVEAKQIETFCEKINFLVKHDSINEQFKKNLKSWFYYTNGSGISMYIIKHLSSVFYIDYKGNYRLPLGLSIGYYINKVKKKYFKIGGNFELLNDFNKNLSITGMLWKSKIFGNNKTYYDSFRLIYEYNKLDYIKSVSKYENYKINYGGTVDKYISFGIAYNQLKTEKTYDGVFLGVSKEFESIKLKPYFNIDLFENKITNYKLGLDKSFQIITEKKNFSVNTSLFYEKTFDFRSLNFSLFIPIKDWKIN